MEEINIEQVLQEKAPIINEAIERYIPRRYDQASLVLTLGRPRFDYDLDVINKAVSEPIWEFLDRGGKRWRPTLFLLVCEALGKNGEGLVDLAIIPEVIHNGTLIIDDIEDDSEFRRGKPCSHKVFGLDLAINAGNLMYYLPLLSVLRNKNKISEHTRNKIYETYIREMINISFGQATDIAWHQGLGQANERQYLQMCIDKTGNLARMSAKLAAILAGASDDFVEKIGRFAESIGVAFQIQDDLLDLVGKQFAKMKGGIGQDITEGKRTLMVIYTLEKAKPKDKTRLLEILRLQTANQELRNEAIKILRESGSIEYAKNFARSIVEESWREIESFLPSSEAKEKLKAFANYLIERRI